MKITFELSESDLKHFKQVMKKAKSAAKHANDKEIIDSAKALLEEVRAIKGAPEFITDRLESLDALIGMVSDSEWKLPAPDRARVISALAYFADPEDMIPDDIPGLGFLDDAIMIELVCRELRHEIEAFQDFCRYRELEEERRAREGKDTDVTREEWLVDKRKALHSRMRRRRTRDRSRRSAGGGRFTIF